MEAERRQVTVLFTHHDLLDAALMKQQNCRDDPSRHVLSSGPAQSVWMKRTSNQFAIAGRYSCRQRGLSQGPQGED